MKFGCAVAYCSVVSRQCLTVNQQDKTAWTVQFWVLNGRQAVTERLWYEEAGNSRLSLQTRGTCGHPVSHSLMYLSFRWWDSWWWIRLENLYLCTQCLKEAVQNCFCQNFFKFPPILIIFDRTMAKMLQLCEMRSVSTSPHSCHHTIVLNC